MPNPEKQNANREAGEKFTKLAGAGGVNGKNDLPKTAKQNDTPNIRVSNTPDIINNKSTATAVQLDKTMALLRQGPKTTMDLRDHGIMMPAARVFQLKHERNQNIASELVTLYDANGYRHRKCARYHLIADASVEVTA